MHCAVFSSSPDLYPLDTSSKSSLPLVRTQMFADIVKCSLGDKLSPVGNHCVIQSTGPMHYLIYLLAKLGCRYYSNAHCVEEETD